jgi:glycosyltransferase involved in cell wall biosynthesis
LDNTLELDYPKEKLEIIIASDGSTDQTNNIVKNYEQRGVKLVVIKEHRGKENAQKKAIGYAKGDVFVFTDVATYLEPRGLKEIVSNFADPTVGCVSSKDRLIEKDVDPNSESIYIRYEMWLRGLESKVSSLIGLSGSFFAARKTVCDYFFEGAQSDFQVVLNCIKSGLKGIIDPSAIGYYQNVSDEKKEFNRKVRTVVRGLTVFFNNIELLNIFQYGLIPYQYFCHKLLRWLVPFFLVTAFVTNAILAINSLGYYILLIVQSLFYALGFLGICAKSFSSDRIFIKIPMYFLTVNSAITVGWWRYLNGQRMVMWTPSDR